MAFIIGFLLGAWTVVGFIVPYLVGMDAKDDFGDHLLPEWLHRAVDRVMMGNSVAALVVLQVALGPFGWLNIFWVFGIKPGLRKVGVLRKV